MAHSAYKQSLLTPPPPHRNSGNSRRVIFPFLIFFLFGTASFAQSVHHFEAGYGGPTVFSYGQATLSPGIALNWYNAALFSPKGTPIGLGVWTNFSFPLYENGDRGFLFDAFCGLVFSRRAGAFAFPAAMGLVFDGVSVFQTGRRALNLGVGANVAAEWRAAPPWYAWVRVQGAYTFPGGGEIILTPSAGAGLEIQKQQGGR
jgi:hypothetical protein